MSLQVEQWSTDTDGPLNEAALRAGLVQRRYSVTRYVYPSGTVFPDHTHTVGKIDAVLSGRLLMRIEGQQVTLEVGDMLEVPRDVVHSAAVVGNGPVVSVDAAKMNGS